MPMLTTWRMPLAAVSRDQVLRQVGKHLGRLDAQRIEAAGVALKRFAQIEVATMRFVVPFQRGPGGDAITTQRVHRQAPVAEISASVCH